MNDRADNPYSIMVAADNPHDLRLLSEMLGSRGYCVRPLPNGEMALSAAAKEAPDLILLDTDMPGMSGFEVCRRLKQDPSLRDIPILFISALQDTKSVVNGLEYGGLDFISKPFRFEEVDARVRTHLKLRQLQRDLEEHNSNLERLVGEQVTEISDAHLATMLIQKVTTKRQ